MGGRGTETDLIIELLIGADDGLLGTLFGGILDGGENGSFAKPFFAMVGMGGNGLDEGILGLRMDPDAGEGGVVAIGGGDDGAQAAIKIWTGDAFGTVNEVLV